MKREDWLKNKKAAKAPRPKRIFELTDELIDALRFHYGDRLYAQGYEDILVEYLETLPAFFDGRTRAPCHTVLGTLTNSMHEMTGLTPELGMKVWTLSANGTTAVLFVKTSQVMGGIPMQHTYTMNKLEDGKWKLIVKSDLSDTYYGEIGPHGGWVDTYDDPYASPEQPVWDSDGLQVNPDDPGLFTMARGSSRTVGDDVIGVTMYRGTSGAGPDLIEHTGLVGPVTIASGSNQNMHVSSITPSETADGTSGMDTERQGNSEEDDASAS